MIYFGLGLLWALIVGIGTLITFNKKSVVGVSIASSIAFVLGTLFAYLFTPVIGFFYIGFWFYLFIPVLVVALMPMFAGFDNTIVSCKPLLGFSGMFLLFLVFSFVTTNAFMNHDRYHQLLTVKSENQFDPDSVFLDQSQARFVDQDLASRSANEILGKERGLASRYNVDTMRIQNINDQLRWLAPLKHASFTRWLDDNTSPGYVTVSVNEYSDANLRIDENDVNYGSAGYYFNTDVERHVYQSGYSDKLVEDYTLEVDDNGKPFWVGSIVEPQVGFSGKVVTGVISVDAKSGAIEEFSVEEAPEWIDRIQPEGIVNDLITNWGKYAGSWWDGFVGNNVIVATRGSSIVFSKEGKASWYTGMQSNSGNTESSMGFMMVDTRTGVATFYQRSGITEMVAKQAIEGRVQESEYSSSYPVPYSINGKTTFLSILKDKRGNVQGVGLVAYDNRSLVAFGENFTIALRRYMSTISSNGDTDLPEDYEALVVEGVIDRSFVQNVDSRLVLNFTLKGEEYKGMFFLTSADSNKSAMLARDGDVVEIEVYSLDDTEIQVPEFTNLSLSKQ